MKTATLLKSLLSTLGYVGMFIYVESLLDGKTDAYAAYLAIGGALLLSAHVWLAKKIGKEGFKVEVAKKVLQVFAYIVLFIGIKHYLNGFVEGYGLFLFLLSAMVFSFHGEIIDKTVGNYLNSSTQQK